jgi:Domain of unknown function (DUF4336)
MSQQNNPLPHQPLQQLAPDLWIANQPLRFMGLPVGTRMTVIRLADGHLVVISPIALTPELTTQLNRLGSVAYQIAPNRYHHLFAQAFQQQYPGAAFWGATGLQEKRPDLKIEHVITAEAGDIGADLLYRQFSGINVPGSTLSGLGKPDPLNEVVFCHKPSRTLVITDIAFHFDETNAWETRLVGKLIGGYKALQPTLLEKWSLTNRDLVERSIRAVLAWDFDRVIMAHGSIIETNGKAMLKAGYEWLLDQQLD